MLHKGTHCTGHVLADTRPYQLHWGDGEVETAISCRKSVLGVHMYTLELLCMVLAYIHSVGIVIIMWVYMRVNQVCVV